MAKRIQFEASRVHLSVTRAEAILCRRFGTEAQSFMMTQHNLNYVETLKAIAAIQKLPATDVVNAISHIDVVYKMGMAELEVTDAEYAIVNECYNCTPSRKVMAIKFLRTQYDLTLRDAKFCADAIGASSFSSYFTEMK